jgi:hypothetical protein
VATDNLRKHLSFRTIEELSAMRSSFQSVSDLQTLDSVLFDKLKAEKESFEGSDQPPAGTTLDGTEVSGYVCSPSVGFADQSGPTRDSNSVAKHDDLIPPSAKPPVAGEIIPPETLPANVEPNSDPTIPRYELTPRPPATAPVDGSAAKSSVPIHTDGTQANTVAVPMQVPGTSVVFHNPGRS